MGGITPHYGRTGGRFGGHGIAVMGLTGRRRVAARSGELCPLPVPSCLQPGRARLLSPALCTNPHPLSQPPHRHSLPSGVSGEELGTRLVPGTRPGGEKGGGDGDGSSCKDRAKKDGKSREGVHPPAATAQDGGAAPHQGDVVTFLPLTCPAAPWPPVSSSTTREGKTPTRPSKSPVQKPSSTSPGARGSTRMMAPSGKLSSSGLCPS